MALQDANHQVYNMRHFHGRKRKTKLMVGTGSKPVSESWGQPVEKISGW